MYHPTQKEKEAERGGKLIHAKREGTGRSVGVEGEKKGEEKRVHYENKGTKRGGKSVSKNARQIWERLNKLHSGGLHGHTHAHYNYKQQWRSQSHILGEPSSLLDHVEEVIPTWARHLVFWSGPGTTTSPVLPGVDIQEQPSGQQRSRLQINILCSGLHLISRGQVFIDVAWDSVMVQSPDGCGGHKLDNRSVHILDRYAYHLRLSGGHSTNGL